MVQHLSVVCNLNNLHVLLRHEAKGSFDEQLRKWVKTTFVGFSHYALTQGLFSEQLYFIVLYLVL